MTSIFSNISPITFSTSAVIVGNVLIDGLTTDEQNTLANWLQLVGQVIITNAGQQELIDNQNTNTQNQKKQDPSSDEATVEIKG